VRLDGRGRRGRRRGRRWCKRWRRKRGRRRGGWRWRRGRAVGQVAPAVRPDRRYLGLEAVVDHTLLAVGKGVGALPGAERGRRGMPICARAVQRRRAAGKARSLRAVWRDGAAARAYIEHAIHAIHAKHARDLRDVPVQGLVEAGGVLPGAERGGRGMLRRACGVEAAGCRQGGRLVCDGAMGQRSGRT